MNTWHTNTYDAFLFKLISKVTRKIGRDGFRITLAEKNIIFSYMDSFSMEKLNEKTYTVTQCDKKVLFYICRANNIGF